LRFAREEIEKRGGVQEVQQQSSQAMELPKRDTSPSIQSSGSSGSTAISLLKIFAWVDLVGSVAGAVIVLKWFSSQGQANPIAIGLAIAVLLQGVLVCSLFLVIASMAENVIAIRFNNKRL
jgi:hypothetical protein